MTTLRRVEASRSGTCLAARCVLRALLCASPRGASCLTPATARHQRARQIGSAADKNKELGLERERRMERLQSKGGRRRSAGAGAGGGRAAAAVPETKSGGDDDDGPKITCVRSGTVHGWLLAPAPWLIEVLLDGCAFCSVCVRKRPLSRREKSRKEVDVLKPVSRQTILVYEPKYVSSPKVLWGQWSGCRHTPCSDHAPQDEG